MFLVKNISFIAGLRLKNCIDVVKRCQQHMLNHFDLHVHSANVIHEKKFYVERIRLC